MLYFSERKKVLLLSTLIKNRFKILLDTSHPHMLKYLSKEIFKHDTEMSARSADINSVFLRVWNLVLPRMMGRTFLMRPSNQTSSEEVMKLFYQPNERPKFGQMIVFAIQQLLAIMAATLVVPVIIGNGMSPAAALFGAGAGTLVYVLFTKRRSPVFLGSSFAFLGSMAAAFAGAVSVEVGYLGLIIGAILAGLVYVVIAILVKIVGVEWLNKLMPAVVIGPPVQRHRHGERKPLHTLRSRNSLRNDTLLHLR